MISWKEGIFTRRGEPWSSAIFSSSYFGRSKRRNKIDNADGRYFPIGMHRKKAKSSVKIAIRANGACVRNVQGKLHDAPHESAAPHSLTLRPGEFRRSPGQPVPNDYPLKSWSREQLCGGARVNSIIALYSVPRVIATFPRMQIPLRRGTTETYHRRHNYTRRYPI